MARIFSNAGQVRASAGDCVGGYSPSSGDKRRLRVTIIDNGTPTTLSPDQEIVSVPYATVAETLQGLSPPGFIQVSGAVTQANLSDLLAKKTELLNLAVSEAALTALASGASSLYMKPAAGGVSLIGTGNISLSSQKSLQLGTYSNPQQTTFVSGLASSDKGKTWYNSDTNVIMYWDGSSAKPLGTAAAISSLNGSSQVTQSFALASAGASPAWTTDVATGVHTLALPSASSAGVTAGLVSNSEYAGLATKTYSDAHLAGKNVAVPTIAEDGKSLRWNNTSAAWEYFSAGNTSDFLLVSNALSEINSAGVVARLAARTNLGASSTGEAIFTAANAGAARTTLGLGGAAVLSVGIGSGTVAAGDDSRITGALQQSVFNGYVTGVSGASACTTGQMMYWNSVSSAFACANISIDLATQATGTLNAARLPASAVVDGGNAPSVDLVVGTTNANGFQIKTNGTPRVVVDSGGNVGIDVASPTVKLDVNGAIKAGAATVSSLDASGGVKVGSSTTCNASTAGTIRWTGTAFEGCNGSSWGSLSASSTSSCVLPWGGLLAHGSSVTAYQACGSSVSEARTCNNGTLSGSYTSQLGNTIGAVCNDGSVYAGMTPDGNVPMFTTPCDAGQSWSGSACTGSRAYQSWANTTGTSIGASSDTAGETNTGVMVTNPDRGPHWVGIYCNDLVANGYSDWYLPAKSELNVLYANRTAIGNFNLSPSGHNDYYWSSTEFGGNAWNQNFSNGSQESGWAQYDGNIFRCVRK